MPTANLSTVSIKAATWGSSDVRGTVEHALEAFINSNPAATAWSFQASNSFFGNDPNRGDSKACVVFYQYSLITPDGGQAFSTFQTAAAREDNWIIIDPVGKDFSTYSLPPPNAGAGVIFAASWWTVDVTGHAQIAYSNQPSTREGSIIVSPNTLGPDPIPNVVKQCTVLYARQFPGGWRYTLAIGRNENSSYELNLPRNA